MDAIIVNNIHDCREFVKYGSYYPFYKFPYSDECDFSETIIIFGLDKIMHADIYLRGRKVKVDSTQDLSLYYAFKEGYIGNENKKLVIKLSDVDYNTWQIKNYGDDYIEFVEKYRKNWYEAIIANGFDKEFAWKWVYEQAYCDSIVF